MQNIIQIKENKIPKKKYFKSFNKIPKNLFYLAIIELILLLTNMINIFSSLFKNNSLRKLQYYDNSYNQGNSGYTDSNRNNNNNIKKTEAYEPINPVIIVFFVFFVLFLFLCLYMICEIKKIAPEKVSEYIKDNIYKFIYMANSGFFFTAICYSPMINDLSVGYLTLGVSGIIFAIGSIILLKNLIKDTGCNCFEDFTILDKLKNYFRLPCYYVWPFVGLTDPCCEGTTYTVTTYSDGTTSSTKSCVECWNMFILIVKRIVVFISIIFFYFFLIYLTVIFLLFKLFYLLITQIIKCCQNSNTNNQNDNPNIPNNNDINSNNEISGNHQILGNNRINSNRQILDTTKKLENQLVNYIIHNQIQNPNPPSEEIFNVKNQTSNQATKLVIKDESDNNLPAPEMPNQNIDKNDIINIKNKEN